MQFSTIRKDERTQGEELSLRQDVNPLSLASSFDTGESHRIFEESRKLAEELEMKADRVEDTLEHIKEEKLQKNLETLDKSMQMIEEFKRFNIDDNNYSSLVSKKTVQNSVNMKVEDEI